MLIYPATLAVVGGLQGIVLAQSIPPTRAPTPQEIATPDSLLIVDWLNERVVGVVQPGVQAILDEARRRRQSGLSGADNLFLVAAHRAVDAGNTALEQQILQELLTSPENGVGACRALARLARAANNTRDWNAAMALTDDAMTALQDDTANLGSTAWALSFVEMVTHRVTTLQNLGLHSQAADEIGDFLHHHADAVPVAETVFSLRVTRARLLAHAGRIVDSDTAWASVIENYPGPAVLGNESTLMAWQMERARTWADHGMPEEAVRLFFLVLLDPANETHPNFIAATWQADNAYRRATHDDGMDAVFVDRVLHSASVWQARAGEWYAGPDAPHAARHASDLTGLGWAILSAAETALEHRWLDRARSLGEAYIAIVEAVKPERGGGRGILAKVEALELQMNGTP